VFNILELVAENGIGFHGGWNRLCCCFPWIFVVAGWVNFMGMLLELRI
jgi:hypothetical protein